MNPKLTILKLESVIVKSSAVMKNICFIIKTHWRQEALLMKMSMNQWILKYKKRWQPRLELSEKRWRVGRFGATN